MEMTQNRDSIVDIAKGIGILLVLAVHSDIGFLYGLNMPFFFFVAGFFAPTTSKIGFIDGIKQKSLTLLKPTFLYIIFSVFWHIFYAESLIQIFMENGNFLNS